METSDATTNQILDLLRNVAREVDQIHSITDRTETLVKQLENENRDLKKLLTEIREHFA